MSRRKEKKKSFIRRLLKSFFLLLFFLTIIVNILALSAKYINAQTWFLPSLISLSFPYIFLAFFFMILLALFIKYYKTVLIALPFFIWGATVFNRYLNISSIFTFKDCIQSNNIKVMSFNVRLFDLYSWKTNHPNHHKILNFIVQQNPDIACFQEYYSQTDGKYPTTSVLLKGLKTNNIHEYYQVINRNTDQFGIATITQFPIINKGEIVFKGTSNMCIYTDILYNNDTIRVYNMHLESVRLEKEDYAFIAAVEQRPDSIQIYKSKSIIKHVINATKKRNKQADVIATHIKSCPYPVIVCGDFNDTPASYTYSVISENLNDSYSIIDKKLGTTYNGNIPFLRIDYILYSSEFNSCHYKIHRLDMSDHFPITCDIGFKENNTSLH